MSDNVKAVEDEIKEKITPNVTVVGKVINDGKIEIKGEELPQTPKPKTEAELAQEFIKAYSDLCEKYQFQIVVVPAWKARDDGTFSLVQQTSIGKLPQKV